MESEIIPRMVCCAKCNVVPEPGVMVIIKESELLGVVASLEGRPFLSKDPNHWVPLCTTCLVGMMVKSGTKNLVLRAIDKFGTFRHTQLT